MPHAACAAAADGGQRVPTLPAAELITMHALGLGGNRCPDYHSATAIQGSRTVPSTLTNWVRRARSAPIRCRGHVHCVQMQAAGQTTSEHARVCSQQHLIPQASHTANFLGQTLPLTTFGWGRRRAGHQLGTGPRKPRPLTRAKDTSHGGPRNEHKFTSVISTAHRDTTHSTRR